MENKVSDEKRTVDFFVHENDMMHKDVDNERLHGTIRTICITFITIILVFVTAYTIRTNIWLNTIKDMNRIIAEMAGVEVDDAPVHQQSD